MKVIRNLLTPAGVACLIVSAGLGLAWFRGYMETQQARDFSAAQSVEGVQRVQVEIESARLEAMVMAAEPGAKLSGRSTPGRSSEAAVGSLPDAAGRIEVTSETRATSATPLLKPGTKLLLPVVPMAGEEPALSLYPAKSPTHLVIVAAGPEGAVGLTAVNLRELLSNINPADTGYSEYELFEAGTSRPLAATDTWDSSPGTVTASSTMAQPMALTLRTQPSNLYLTTIGLTHRGWILFGSFLVAAAAYLLVARVGAAARLIHEKDAKWNAAQANHRANLEITLANFTEAAGTMLWLARPEGDVQLFGPWPELEGRDSNLFTFEELTVGVREGASLIKSLVAAVQERTSWAYTHQKDMDGERNVFQEGAAPVFTPLGLYLGLVGIRTNVSEVVRAQQSTSKTEAIRAGQESYLSHMSSEISAPAQQAVAALRFLSAAIEKGDAVSTARWLTTSLTAAERVDATVKGALAVMRQKAGASRPVLVADTIDKCVQEVVNARKAAATRSGRVVVLTGKTSQRTRFAASSLVRILDELISNSLKFAPAGTTVSVAIADDETGCFVSVTDEGPGMTDDELQRIARPFYRTASAMGVEGRGLGIPMAKELAEAMGARLRFARATKSSGGLVATIAFPAAEKSESEWMTSDFGNHQRGARFHASR